MSVSRKITAIGIFLASFLLVIPVLAGAPAGADTFQLLASPYTGGDNTGDGGTGAAGDLNYFYVGQTFSTQIQIVSGGTTSSNIWIDYDSGKVSASNLSEGTYFNTWSGQTIDPDATGATGGRVYSTGAEIPVVAQVGTGNFGSVDWVMNEPSAAAYGTGAPEKLDINVGTIGETTESNISNAGVDLLDDEEDFQFHIWADTVDPFAENPSPANATVDVSVSSNYTFDLRDTLNGEGDNSGVGTGLNLSTGALTFNDGGGAVDYTAYDSYSCSGTWGTNLCSATVNPPSPLSIGGDARNWEYATTYTVNISNFQDLASSSQDQLGDANGPNTMATKVYTFTTESDTVAPEVVAETPVRSSTGVSTSTDLVIDIEDRKSYPSGVSGVGIDSSTCQISVSSPSFTLTNYGEGDAGVSVSALSYGYRFTIDPASDFSENETVSISVSGCEDLVGNAMVTDNYSFTTEDTGAPYVDTLVPEDDAEIDADGTISFHIKDAGTGIDLSNTVVYVNGVYYTDGGGAGSVTVSGTRITFDDSLDYNGSNYIGDTTSITGAPSDYTILIDPETDFIAGETVPVIVYSRDTTGNIMERVVFGVSVIGAACPAGTSYCGDDTSWDGAQCIGTGGGTGGSCVEGSSYCGTGTEWTGSQCVDIGVTRNGGGYNLPRLYLHNIVATQVDEDSVLITWFSSKKATARVIYDTEPLLYFGDAPNYGMDNSTIQFDDNSVYHGVVVNGLTAGQLYYFRPVSISGGIEEVGEEVIMAPVFATETVEVYVNDTQELTCPELPICESEEVVIEVPTECPDCPACEEVGDADDDDRSEDDDRDEGEEFVVGEDEEDLSGEDILDLPSLRILSVERTDRGIVIKGSGIPNSRITLEIE